MKKTRLIFLLVFLPLYIYGRSPDFRDEFGILNKTNDRIVVVFETIGLIGPRLKYQDDNKYILFNFSNAANASGKSFRTIRRGQSYHIGFAQYDDEDFNKFFPADKFSAFFKYILIFNSEGDLLYRIDDFSKFKIEDHTQGGPGVYVLIIE
jgi:hypothetical protein